MSLSVLLAKCNDITLLDIDQDLVDKINSRQSIVSDAEIQLFLGEKVFT
jgi:UDP-glucose 6-dehydrogenase